MNQPAPRHALEKSATGTRMLRGACTTGADASKSASRTRFTNAHIAAHGIVAVADDDTIE